MLVLVVSTTGDGEPPDTVARFWRRLKKKTLPQDHLSLCRYALLGRLVCLVVEVHCLIALFVLFSVLSTQLCACVRMIAGSYSNPVAFRACSWCTIASMCSAFILAHHVHVHVRTEW